MYTTFCLMVIHIYANIWYAYINKRPMGHLAHLRKQLKSINTYDYIITLFKRRKKPLLSLWELNGSSFEQNWVPFTQGCFVPSLFKIGPVGLDDFLNSIINVFSLFRIYLPLEKGGALLWTNLNPLHPRMLCARFGWNWLIGFGEEDFFY